jgi:putative ABC transport system permease protein
MHTLLRKIQRDLRRRPLRNLLTLLGVVLGVAGIVAIAFTTRALSEAQANTYDGSMRADIAGFTGDLSPTVKNLIERQSDIDIVDSWTVAITRFDAGDGWHNLRLIGVEDFGEMQLDIVDLVEGRFPGRGEIAFDESTRELSPVEIGQTVAIRRSSADPIEYLTVSGFTRSPAALGAGLMNRATAYSSAGTVRAYSGRSADNYILIRVMDTQRTSQIASDVSRLLSKRGVFTGNFVIRDPTEFVGSRELNTLLLLLSVFSILGAALASFLVANTMLAVMAEESNQIGIIKSLGGRRWQVSITYLGYSLLLGAAGTIIGLGSGLAIGLATSRYLTGLTGLQQPGLSVAPREIGLAALVGAVVTLAATLIPALRGASGPIAPLLRSAGVRSEDRLSFIRKITAPVAEISPTVAVGLRNVLRRPGRTLMTLIVVTVAVASFISTQALSRSVSTTVDELYELYGADAWISFRRPVSDAFVREIGKNPDVVQVETWTSATGAIGSTRTDIWGMPEVNPLYSYRLVEGDWVTRSNPTSAVLSKNLADSIGARVGQKHILDVGQRTVPIHVVGIVDDSSTYLGSTTTGKVFMTTADVNRLIGRSNTADVFALKFTASDIESVDRAIVAIEDRTRDQGPVTLAAYSDQESARRAIDILTLMLNAMVIVVAAVGLIGIANTLLINITERRREFGVLRTVGARSSHIVAILVSEGVMLASIGLVAGAIIGYPLARLMVNLTSEELFELSFHLSLLNVLTTFALALLAVAAVSAVPGVLASRIRPIQVLRYE